MKRFVVLQSRDVELFQFVSEQKFATREQIQRRFFPGRKREAQRRDAVCMRRLGELCKFGFLERRHVVTDLAQLFQAGRAALVQIANRSGAALPYLGGIDLKGYEHDLRVTDTRIRLEELGAHDWRSERQLHQAGYRGRIPDALFELGENRCALELELSLKRLDRYPAIFRGYAQTRDPVGAVFYLCGSRAIRDTLTRIAGDARRFYFGLWSEFAEAPASAVFANRHDRVSLAELT
jgi:hypothetical protein